MHAMTKVTQVIRWWGGAVFFTWFIAGGIFITAASAAVNSSPQAGTPESAYKECLLLKAEAQEFTRSAQWGKALEDYQTAVKKLRAIKQEYPAWKANEVEEEYQVCLEKVGLLEAKVLWEQAYGYFDARRYNSAFTAFNQLLAKYGEKYKKYPLVVSAWKHIGDIYRLQGKFTEALKAYDTAFAGYQEASINDPSLLAFNQLGKALASRAVGNYDAADKLLREAIAQNPVIGTFDSFLEVLPLRSWASLGKALPIIEEYLSTGMSDKEFQGAVMAVDKGMGNDALAFVGIKLQMQGKNDQAIKIYNACVRGSSRSDNLGVRIATVALRKMKEKAR
jgi:tetratricopeptide (TPR) repeat protein